MNILSRRDRPVRAVQLYEYIYKLLEFRNGVARLIWYSWIGTLGAAILQASNLGTLGARLERRQVVPRTVAATAAALVLVVCLLSPLRSNLSLQRKTCCMRGKATGSCVYLKGRYA